MICPYCSGEMENGVIQSPNEIAWQKEKHLFASSDIHDGSVCLSRHSFLKGSSVEAWLCRVCSKVIIEYSAAAK